MIFSKLLFNPSKCNGAWSFNRESKCSGPNQIGSASKCSWNSKHNSVIFKFFQAIVIQQHTWVSINIWPWILDLTNSFEDRWNDMITLLDQINQWIIFDQSLSKILLMDISWISVSQNSMTISWYYFTLSYSVKNIFLNFFIWNVVTQFFLKI